MVGAVYVNGRRAPTLVSDDLVSRMEPGSAVIDVAVDQGGCVESIYPTTHADPTYLVHEIIHYGVTNMPGAVPRTSTRALTNTTLPFVQRIAAHGVLRAVKEDHALALGANVWEGALVHEGVATSLDLKAEKLPR